MGCGCLIALLALVSPRLAIFFLWLLTSRLSIAFTSGLIAVVGFLFLPWTTLAWAVAYQPVRGVTGYGWLIVALAFVLDMSSYLNGEWSRRRRVTRATRS